MDNKRSYGTVLVGKTKPEDRAPSPCVRYFIDADGNRITEPEEYTPPECTGWLPEESFETEEEEMTPKTLDKPTAEQLRADQLVMNKLQAMKKYNCSKTTIERWTKEFSLPHWKQTREWRTETQNEAVLPSGGSVVIDSIPDDTPNAPEPNTEQEVLEELSTLDDIPFGEEPTEEEILTETEPCETPTWPTWWGLWSNGDLAGDTEDEPEW